MARSWQSDVLDRPAPRRSATMPGARCRPRLDAKIDGAEVSWRASLAVPSLSQIPCRERGQRPVVVRGGQSATPAVTERFGGQPDVAWTTKARNGGAGRWA